MSPNARRITAALNEHETLARSGLHRPLTAADHARLGQLETQIDELVATERREGGEGRAAMPHTSLAVGAYNAYFTHSCS